MKECIEREAALKAFEPQCGDWSECWSAEEIKPKLESIPAAEVVEVRHGQWLYEGMIEKTWRVFICSLCGGQCIDSGSFCPNCGAKMDGGADDAAD